MGVEPIISLANQLRRNGLGSSHNACVVYRVILGAGGLPAPDASRRKRERMIVVPISIAPTPEWLQDDLGEYVELVLRSLHITGKLDGLRYLVYAVSATVRDPDRTRYITRELYPEIGKHFGVTAAAAERAMRTAIQTSWERGGRETLDKMAGFHLTERPTNSEFIDIVAAYIVRRL